MMSYLNKLNLSLPYFASKENQTLYVVVPAVNPMVFKQSHEDIVNFSTEEEILPDYRCKICYVRIPTYSEFKVHQQDHEKAKEDVLKKSHFLEADKFQLLRSPNCGLKLNPSENFKNNPMFDPLKYTSHLRTAKNTNGVQNIIFPSEIALNTLPEEYKRHLPSNKTVVSINNYVCSLNNSKKSACSKFGESLEMKNGMLEMELKKSNPSKLPFIQTLNKCGAYVLKSKFSNPIDANLSHIKGNFDSNSTLNNENSSVSNQMHSSTISREIIQGRANKIPAAESSASNVTLTLTYTGLKQLFTPRKRKKVAEVIKPYFASSYQSQLTTLSRDSKDSEKEIIQERILGIRNNQTMNQLNGSISTFHSLSDPSNYSAVNYFENDISIADNTRGEILVCDKSRPSNIISLQSANASDHSPLLKPLSNAKERDKLPVKPILAYKESFLNGKFPETPSEKETNQMIDKFDDFISTSQPLGNISSSAVTTCSEYEMHAQKTNTDEAAKYDGSPLKTSALQSADTSDRDVYILEPSTNAKIKPMRCFYCRKTFKSCVQMRRHLLLHEESKTIFCDMCNLFFTRISTFRSHLLIFHCQAKDGKKCPYCEYRCFRSTNLENHLVGTHLKYKCTICMKRFLTARELNNHLKRKHLH